MTIVKAYYGWFCILEEQKRKKKKNVRKNGRWHRKNGCVRTKHTNPRTQSQHRNEWVNSNVRRRM